jgi:hypothetical protein
LAVWVLLFWFDRGADETAIPDELDDFDDDDLDENDRTAAILIILIILFLDIMEQTKPGSSAGLGFWIHPTQTCPKIWKRMTWAGIEP